MSRSVTYPVLPCAGAADAAWTFGEGTPVEPRKPRLLERVRSTLRLRHYSRRTEQAYVAWIRRYIFFHGKRHPAELGPAELTAFLSSLAVEGHVAASTQNLRIGTPAPGMLPPSRPGHRLRREPDRGARRQGRQGPDDRPAWRHQDRPHPSSHPDA